MPVLPAGSSGTARADTTEVVGLRWELPGAAPPGQPIRNADLPRAAVYPVEAADDDSVAAGDDDSPAVAGKPRSRSGSR